MSVQELNRVHRRYIKISNSFKSAWTFHQFIQGLRKVFLDDGPSSYPADFQSVYNVLKQVSQNLSEATLDEASTQLDQVEDELRPLIDTLLAADSQVSPGLLRQFFQRVKNYDDNILSQLVKFYLYFRGDEVWDIDRLDKADYLSTKVCEEYQDTSDTYVLRDRTHVRETSQGFWAALSKEPAPEAEVSTFVKEIEALRREIAGAESIDDLHHDEIVKRYRRFKHELGDTFFQPMVLQALLETNLVLKNHVQQLYQRDEQRIVAEYQQVFELERETPPIDTALREDLAEFREAVESFEQQLQGGDNIRLEHLATLRRRVRDLMPRLQPSEVMPIEPMPMPPELRELKAAEALEAGTAPVSSTAPEDDYVESQYLNLVSTLDDTNSALEPWKIVVQPGVFDLGLEAREVLAYRRLYSGGECDRRREEIILRAASHRMRIEEDVETVRGILDETAASRDSPTFAEARTTLRHADLALKRLEHLIEISVLAADGSEARALQRLKMKLLRSYTGLWLLVYKE